MCTRRKSIIKSLTHYPASASVNNTNFKNLTPFFLHTVTQIKTPCNFFNYKGLCSWLGGWGYRTMGISVFGVYICHEFRRLGQIFGMMRDSICRDRLRFEACSNPGIMDKTLQICPILSKFCGVNLT